MLLVTSCQQNPISSDKFPVKCNPFVVCVSVQDCVTCNFLSCSLRICQFWYLNSILHLETWKFLGLYNKKLSLWKTEDLTLSSINTHFIACATIVDPDQPAHPCRVIRICTVCFFVRNNWIHKKVNSAEQMPWMCQLIWIYTVYPCHKGLYNMEERVKFPVEWLLQPGPVGLQNNINEVDCRSLLSPQVDKASV
jgi:hypothetical protein